MTTYRAVIFDLFGTLVRTFPIALFEECQAAMASAVGVGVDAFHHAWVRETAGRRFSGEFPTIEANVDEICRARGVTPTADQVAKAARIRREFTRRIFVPREDAVPTLRALAERGVGRGLVSDCSADVPDLWPETPLADLIQTPIFSCRAGTRKPDERIYRLACAGLGVEPIECIYIGDGFSRELTGAAAVGMRPLLLAPPDEEGWETGGYERQAWDGERISALGRVLDLVDHR